MSSIPAGENPVLEAAPGTTRIIGVVLLRNEEFFTPWAIANIVAFCDEIIVLDNMSTDRTATELAAFAARYPNVRVERIADAHTSHDWVEPYADTRTWLFGVDGDEIYDPVGLARLRQRILSGALDRYWRVYGHLLHATTVDLDGGGAEGYITPASHSITKLYNMAATASWREERHERFHGDAMVFSPGYSRASVLKLHETDSWDACDLRCLHLCFFPRSSIDDPVAFVRKNPREERAGLFDRLANRAKYFLAHPFSRDIGHKQHKYARGPITRVNIGTFGRPKTAAAFDPSYALAEASLSAHNGRAA
jgi:glycosyltransferase involved in cell wall biosynthesis